MFAGFFWGLWLFPFGLLTIRSGFFPKALGALLILGGSSYIVDSLLALFAPMAREQVTDFLMLPLATGEVSMLAWLLVRGVRKTRDTR